MSEPEPIFTTDVMEFPGRPAKQRWRATVLSSSADARYHFWDATEKLARAHARAFIAKERKRWLRRRARVEACRAGRIAQAARKAAAKQAGG